MRGTAAHTRAAGVSGSPRTAEQQEDPESDEDDSVRSRDTTIDLVSD
jgi:hypothetical protein